jgi:hypothetical protein
MGSLSQSLIYPSKKKKGDDSQGSMVREDMERLGELAGESCIYYCVMENG